MADALSRAAEAGPVTAATEPRPVDIASIERELEALVGEAPDREDGGAEVVSTRARMSNLVVYASGDEQAAIVAQEIASIVERHPARVLLLVGDVDGDAELDAHVSAVCHLGDGGRQVCSEHVTIRGGTSSARRLPSVARPLLVGDLPTAFWWASPVPPPQAGELFEELADMADQVIYDSGSWADGTRSLGPTARWATASDSPAGVSDLSWARLRPWRGQLRQALDARVAPGALRTLREVTIGYGPAGEAEAWLLGGWLAGRLGWGAGPGSAGPAGGVAWTLQSGSGPVRLSIRPEDGAREASVCRVDAAWDAGNPDHFVSITRDRERRLVIAGTRERLARAVPLPPFDRARLLARELPDLGRDPVYRQALDAARTIAETQRR